MSLAKLMMAAVLTLAGDFLAFVGDAFGWVLESASTLYTNPQVAAWILMAQAIAFASVIVVRIVYGVGESLMLWGGSRPVSTGQYVFKSIMSLVFVMIAPNLMYWVWDVGSTLLSDTKATVGNFSMAAAVEAVKGGLVDNLLADTAAFFASPGIVTASLVVVLVLVIVLCVNLWRFCKRQATMMILSMASPFVAVYTGTTDTSQFADIVKSMAALAVAQSMQWVLLVVGLFCTSQGLLASTTLDGASFPMLFLGIAVMSAATAIDTVLQKFTEARGPSGGSVFAVLGVRTAAGAVRGLARAGR